MTVPEPVRVAPPQSYEELAAFIDHHVLDPRLNAEAMLEQVRVARRYQARCVVVRPCDLDAAKRELGDSSITRLGSVVGFPHGTGTTAAKLFEQRDLLRRGAREIGFMMNLGMLASRQFQYVESEMLQAASQCHEEGGYLKAVIECGLLDDEMKIVAAKICKRSSVDMLETCTGFGAIGFTPRDLRLLLWKCQPYVTLKATHGVHSLPQLLEARELGVARFGVTRTSQIALAWPS